jgi:Fur family peroxide stress response transcriptional regulator
MNWQAAERLARLEQVCRERGVRFTTQRRTVLEVLLQRSDHPTADQIFEVVRVRNPRIARRTVYRVLDDLAQLGLIRRVHHPGAAARFDAKTYRHHHLVCIRCNKIVDLESPDLDSISLPKGRPHGFDVCDLSVQLMGICQECRKGKARPKQGERV